MTFQPETKPHIFLFVLTSHKPVGFIELPVAGCLVGDWRPVVPQSHWSINSTSKKIVLRKPTENTVLGV
jgi:hypothetical protein